MSTLSPDSQLHPQAPLTSRAALLARLHHQAPITLVTATRILSRLAILPAS
ncbi:hypothetical protein HBH56_232790 [Parastagonospora nodorum]|uniref:Uncharacterized protein n=1 Tax=Phaeosphaeria nodorum (strain SN15 / ATCC MYA-4574 / FGSC 10173) TaxID=321614 RepID=A0A7U2NRG9_PHANO|nr:hypothetical protein HBH56_232790 [Parastagonospora nodorum]QRD07711.1 hypothetical protein JI435_424770 [Parastagonospora nodorum SN15]KAH3921411.1 hypothetical protein HBH54_240280 [Parastagonospora nodorum]KAH3967341.1 hypothetical protein HBH52_188990 [Parastagonospora nodorum]KAH3994061.1 hypothetical protein HBI10_194110 [Parastagonospora nodorum]